jgi:hypothetical protein
VQFTTVAHPSTFEQAKKIRLATFPKQEKEFKKNQFGKLLKCFKNSKSIVKTRKCSENSENVSKTPKTFFKTPKK